MTILLTQNLRVGGVVLNSGTTQTFGADLEADIVARKGATYLTDPTPGKTVPVFATTDVTGVSDFSRKLAGNLASGEWFHPPSIFRLLLNGTGTVTIDSKDAAGTITAGVFSVTLASAINQIAFPYAGDAAIQISATLTGTATAKVI